MSIASKPVPPTVIAVVGGATVGASVSPGGSGLANAAVANATHSIPENARLRRIGQGFDSPSRPPIAGGPDRVAAVAVSGQNVAAGAAQPRRQGLRGRPRACR